MVMFFIRPVSECLTSRETGCTDIGQDLSSDSTEVTDNSDKIKSGIIALMGSGELTSTMVEVHKELLGKLPSPASAVFLNTPAGFQLNADQLSQRAVEYFRDKIHHSMSVASFKSKDSITPLDAEVAFHTLRDADFVLIGPGSPTYAIRQWQDTPIREILIRRIERGGCLVAASAAALTVGRFTLPVYEIYKVGERVHWVDGIDILSHFGLNLTVIPHWNNAEGGTHDTRYCYMGEERFRKLESMLPEGFAVLGLDEHTACLMDLSDDTATVRGIGRIIYRREGVETVFRKGDRFPLDLLRGMTQQEFGEEVTTPHRDSTDTQQPPLDLFWERIHRIETRFHHALDEHDIKEVVNALLELDQVVWSALDDKENPEFISQGREILRDFIVLLGTKLDRSPPSVEDCLGPLVHDLLELRNLFRDGKQWKNADAIRNLLLRANILLEDTRDGTRWRLLSSSPRAPSGQLKA